MYFKTNDFITIVTNINNTFTHMFGKYLFSSIIHVLKIFVLRLVRMGDKYYEV